MTPAFMNDKGKGDYLLLKMRMLFSHEHNVLGIGQCHEADEIAEADDYLNKITSEWLCMNERLYI